MEATNINSLVDCSIRFWLLRWQRQDQWVHKIRDQILIDFQSERTTSVSVYRLVCYFSDWFFMHKRGQNTKQCSFSCISGRDAGMLLEQYGRKPKSKGFECLLGGRGRLKKNFTYYSISRADSGWQYVWYDWDGREIWFNSTRAYCPYKGLWDSVGRYYIFK